MIQQIETRFRINDWKKKIFFPLLSVPEAHNNQLHMYDGKGHKQDKEQTQNKEKKSKIKVTEAILILKFMYLFNTW